MGLEIKTAAELVDPTLEARWAARRADRQEEILQFIFRRFVEREGSPEVEEIQAAFPTRPREAVRDTLAALDEKDLILVRAGRVELAYPFSGRPTPFAAIFPDGRVRYAVCAIDVLGIPAMLRERMRIRSRCHHCRGPLEFSAGVEGPHPDAEGIMVWVGERAEGDRRISTTL